MLQAYVVEGRSLKPVSGDLASLSGVYWIDICEPTPDEQKAVEQALGIRLRLPEEPAKFQISTPVRSSEGAITLTALLLAGFDLRRPQLLTVQFIRTKGPLVTVTKGRPVVSLGWRSNATTAFRVARATPSSSFWT